MNFVVCFLIPLILLVCSGGVHSKKCTKYQKYIPFKFYYNNKITKISTSFTEDLSTINGCNPNKPWVIIVHGFTQNCETSWVPQLVAQYAKYRGGCIACMDFSKFGGTYNASTVVQNYISVAMRFKPIVNILVKKLQQFKQQNFSMDLGYLFGQSLGAQMVLEAGKQLNGEISGIDACEPAGPLFFPRSTTVFINNLTPGYKAAKNVQCIHTSSLLGTVDRDCTQDWVMGDCGIFQVCGNGNFWDSHSICSYMYVNAFNNVFPAVDNKCCIAPNRAKHIPPGYRMGYMQKNKGIVNRKVLFARTFKKPPYNKL